MCSTAAPTVPLGTVIRRSSAAKSTARAASLAAARADDVELAVGPMRRMWEQCGQWSRWHGVSELMRLISASRAAARVRRHRTSFSSANEVISQARRFSGLSGRLRVNDKPRKGRSTQCDHQIMIAPSFLFRFGLPSIILQHLPRIRFALHATMIGNALPP